MRKGKGARADAVDAEDLVDEDDEVDDLLVGANNGVEALDDRGLADARVTDQDGVVLQHNYIREIYKIR